MNLALQVTLFRFLAVPILVYLLSFPELKVWTAVFFLLIALTDWLDGFLARRLNQVTDLGKFLDPLADKILVVSLLVVFLMQGRVDLVTVLILINREFVIMGLRLVALTKQKVIAASFSAKIKTVLQLAAIFFILVEWPYGLALYYAAFVFALFSLLEYLWQNRAVFRT